MSVYHEAEGSLKHKKALSPHFVLVLKLDQAQGDVTCAAVRYVFTEIFLAITNPALSVTTCVVLYFFLRALGDSEG